MNNKSETTAEDLLADLYALVAEAEGIMRGTVTEQSDDRNGLPRSRLDAMQEQFGELYANAKNKVVLSAKATDEAIRAKPYQSLAIALGAGLLLGVLLSRSSR
jgi:ElaB/YqjD/DUF883 family membrane-anchored ribosome-binding protein